MPPRLTPEEARRQGIRLNDPAVQPDADRPGRGWLGVHFVCAGKYVRVFRDHMAPTYCARCPTCGKTMTFKVGSGGTEQRLFEVSC